MLAFAVVVVGGVMIAEPLRAVAHFSIVHTARRMPKNHNFRQIQKAVWSRETEQRSRMRNEQRRNTSNAKSVESATGPVSSVGRIASLLIFLPKASSRLFGQKKLFN